MVWFITGFIPQNFVPVIREGTKIVISVAFKITSLLNYSFSILKSEPLCQILIHRARMCFYCGILIVELYEKRCLPKIFWWCWQGSIICLSYPTGLKCKPFIKLETHACKKAVSFKIRGLICNKNFIVQRYKQCMVLDWLFVNGNNWIQSVSKTISVFIISPSLFYAVSVFYFDFANIVNQCKLLPQPELMAYYRCFKIPAIAVSGILSHSYQYPKGFIWANIDTCFHLMIVEIVNEFLASQLAFCPHTYLIINSIFCVQHIPSTTVIGLWFSLNTKAK